MGSVFGLRMSGSCLDFKNASFDRGLKQTGRFNSIPVQDQRHDSGWNQWRLDQLHDIDNGKISAEARNADQTQRFSWHRAITSYQQLRIHSMYSGPVRFP